MTPLRQSNSAEATLDKGFAGQAAMTMIELLLYMGIFSILVTILGNIFVSIVDLQLSSQSTSEVAQNTNYIFERLGYDLYRATSISTPANPGDSGSVLATNIGTYHISGSNLELTNAFGSFILNSSDVNVTAFTVTRLGTTGKANVHIGITIQSNIIAPGKSPQTVSYSQAFTLK